MSMKKIYEIEARLAELEGAERGLPEYLTDLENRVNDVDLRLRALEDGEEVAARVEAGIRALGLTEQMAAVRADIDALELKVDLARPGKRTQRKS